MREDGGYEVIKKAIEKLGRRHKEHIAAYGEGNERRLTGKHETADIATFKWVYAACLMLQKIANALKQSTSETNSFFLVRLSGSCRSWGFHSSWSRH